MSGMLCVGGGVLLATVFVHMIPEVRESLETARKLGYTGEIDPHDGHDEHDHGYPLAELVVCAGFFIIYLIEALVHRVFGLDGVDGHSHGGVPASKSQPPAGESLQPRKNVVTCENGGVDNPGFDANDTTDMPNSPPDTPNTTDNSCVVNQRITSPGGGDDEADSHPDAAVWSTSSPFGTTKAKYK